MIKRLSNFIKRRVHRWLFTYDYQFILDENARKPIRMFKNDAGYDLYVSEHKVVHAKSMVNVPTGVYCISQIPAWIFLTGRSSTLMKHGVLINDGVIDGDYTGELFIKVYNPKDESVLIPKGMRIAQIIVLPHTRINFKFKNRNKKFKTLRGARGDQGFGSTGE